MSIQKLMHDDHNYCDELFIAAENLIHQQLWSDAETSMEKFIKATSGHFEHEENTLFPAFENTTGMRSGPTEVMRHEHQQIKYLINDLNEALAERNQQRCIGLSETLLIFMRQHNMKEEQVLYPMIEQSCSQDADELMKDFVTRESTTNA